MKILVSIFKILLVAVTSTFLAFSLLLTLPPKITFRATSELWNALRKATVEDNAFASFSQNHPFIPECSCFKKNFSSTTTNVSNSSDFQLRSTCSDPRTFNQPNQKVISYSMYFKNRTGYPWLDERFQKGLRENIKLMRKYYPGYTMRVYTDVSLTKEDKYCNILCENPDLFWCDIRHSPSLGNQQNLYFRMWRFLPLGDETVNHFLSRDLDTFIIGREAAAVKDWLQHTPKAIHVMRDYEKAHDLPMLAGMWGASNSRLGLKLAARLRQSIFAERYAHQFYPTFFDQNVLSAKIFFPRRANIVAHDSYHCVRWRKWTIVRPFPKRRSSLSGNFVGNYFYMKVPVSKCPKACRPSYGKGWEYC